MKMLNKIWGIGLIAFSLTVASPHKVKAQDDNYISDQEFYDDLQPYGTWISDPNYGNVWVPDADENFRPYATNGHWVQTDYGTTWVSDYPWGWATFHYGRWRYDDYYGWEWIPGHTWAPAWVSWRHGGGYYGWAPLMPGISISLSFGGGYRVPDNYWVCAPEAYINRPNIYNYYVPPSRSVTIIRNTTIINNTYVYNNQTYITGPKPQDIQRITRQPVQVYHVGNASRPGASNIQNHTVNIYRPAVQKSATARPARVVNATAYKQQNPNQGIGKSGAIGYNRGNASKLAAVARSSNPSSSVVHVNPVNHTKPAQAGANNRTGVSGQNKPIRSIGPVQPSQASKPGQPAQTGAIHRQPAVTNPNQGGNNNANQQAKQRQQQQRQQQQRQQQQRQQQQTQQAQQQRQQQQTQQARQQQTQQAQQQRQQQQTQQAQQQRQQQQTQQAQQQRQQQAQPQRQQQAQPQRQQAHQQQQAQQRKPQPPKPQPKPQPKQDDKQQ